MELDVFFTGAGVILSAAHRPSYGTESFRKVVKQPATLEANAFVVLQTFTSLSKRRGKMARKLLIALSLGSALASPATSVYADENVPREEDRASELSVSESTSAKDTPAGTHTGSMVPQLPEFFPGFTLDGDQSLIALARFYGLRVPGVARGLSIGAYLSRACNGTPCPGDRLRLSHAELWVVETTDNLVTKVGLRPLTVL
jgi:hypothetical protein